MDLHRALRGSVEGNPIWPAFHDAVGRFNIPHRYFDEMIDGVLSDIEPRRLATYEELYQYCYHVASVVGLTIVHIFGFTSPVALLYAEKCGVAFQLTNILRDVREDAEMGRIYLPEEDLLRFGVPVEQLRSGSEDESFRELMRFEDGRARALYDASAPLSEFVRPRSRRSLWALRQIYLALLSNIESANFAVLSRRINVSKPAKLAILARAALK
jgi:phytoene synthase